MNQWMIALFSGVIFFCFGLLVVIFWFTSWILSHPTNPSPYSGNPLRPTKDLSLFYKMKILEYLAEKEEYDNRRFPLDRASYCRETMRVFPRSVTWYGTISVDWTFLNKHYPGNYVSWGSLTNKQQEAIREAQGSLAGFQTEYSSKNSSPRNVESECAFASPGPLYVDPETKVVIGWKRVPETQLEVLIVQKPKIQQNGERE